MRRIVTLAASAALFAGLSMAASWTGRLVDATCADQHKSAASCAATSSTSAFAIDVNGRIYRLDDTGNAKASQALKSRADRTDPNMPPVTTVMARVTGTLNGNTVTVEAIEVQ